MSSALFDVRVVSLSEDVVTFDILTGTAGGACDLCCSRSFALSLIGLTLRGSGAPLERALIELAGGWDVTEWYVSEAWMRDHVGRFISRTEVVERRNHVDEAELARRELEVEAEAQGMDAEQKTRLRWARRHGYTLRVVVTDPEWLVGLVVGQEFSTTAYDVWSERSSPSLDAEAVQAAVDAMDVALRSALPAAVVGGEAPGPLVLAERRGVYATSGGERHELRVQLQGDATDHFLEVRCKVGDVNPARSGLDDELRLRRVEPGAAFLARDVGALVACQFVFPPFRSDEVLSAVRGVAALASAPDAVALATAFRRPT